MGLKRTHLLVVLDGVKKLADKSELGRAACCQRTAVRRVGPGL